MSPHASALAALGLEGERRARLAEYLDRLAAWNPRINLTGARTPEERVRVLVEPVLAAVPLIEESLIDVGSGNGSPGLVLALLRPEIAVTLLEPRAKRWAFLREVLRAAGRPEARVEQARHDQYAGPAAQTVTVRAVALSPAALAGLVVPGGRVLVFGPEPSPDPAFAAEAAPGPGLHVRRRL